MDDNEQQQAPEEFERDFFGTKQSGELGTADLVEEIEVIAREGVALAWLAGAKPDCANRCPRGETDP